MGSFGFRALLAFSLLANSLYANSGIRRSEVYGDPPPKYFEVNNVIVDHKINPEQPSFLQGFQMGSISPDLIDTPVRRDYTKPIIIIDNTISQDNKTIGSYRMILFRQHQTRTKVFYFSSPNGETVAEASVDYSMQVNSSKVMIVISKNQTVFWIRVSAYDDNGIAKELAEWLSRGYYL